jgi:hypothetical protein
LITSFTTNIATTMQLSNNPSGYLWKEMKAEDHIKT